MPYKVVQFTDHLPGGDTLHRETWPMQALGTLDDFRVIDVHHMSPYAYRLAFEADLLILPMIFDPGLPPILRWRRAKGKPTVFEALNQTIFHLDPWTYKFEVFNDPSMQAEYLYMMGLADLVETTTPFEAEGLEPYCPQVVVFGNYLPDEPRDLPPKRASPLVVGWGGSLSHFPGIACIAAAVSVWIAEHENVELWIMGEQAIGDLFALPSGKSRYFPWGDMDAYGEFLDGVHIGLAPMCDSPFNRGRSDAKWLECAIHGCVFVGQRLPPYMAAVEDGKTGFLFGNTVELLRILDRLYADAPLMESVRRAAFDWVSTNRRHRNHIHERAEIYRGLLERKPPPGGESWNLDEQARLPRMSLPDPLPGYLPVKLAPEEESALGALHSPASQISEDSIRLVEERYGQYHHTAYVRAMRACMQGDLDSAEGLLRQSLAFYPAGPPAMLLLGRVLAARGRRAEAHSALSSAIEWYPAYVSAHAALVNVLEQESHETGDWEEAIAAAAAWEKHCNRDPRASIIRGAILIRIGRKREGMDLISNAMDHIKKEWRFWQAPHAAVLARVFQESEASMSAESDWQDLVVKAAEMFPYGVWLAATGGRICFQRGEYQRGARILQAACERLLAWEWQNMEMGGASQQYRRIVEMYRTACEELVQ